MTLFGFVLLGVGLLAGNLIGTHYNRVNDPPGILLLAKPTINLMMLVRGDLRICVLFSAYDVVRWRPNLFGSVVTLAMFILVLIVTPPLSKTTSGSRFTRSSRRTTQSKRW